MKRTAITMSLIALVVVLLTTSLAVVLPAVNAKLHRGDIANTYDGHFAGTQIKADLAGIGAKFRSTNWAGFRSELLAREPFMQDLEVQNDKVQRKTKIERDGNKMGSNKCEQLALTEFSPSLDTYVKATRAEFTLIKGTPKYTSETAVAWKGLAVKSEAARLHFNAYFSDSKGCK